MAGQYFIYIPFNDAGLKKEADNWMQMKLMTMVSKHAKLLKTDVVTDQVKQAVASDPDLRKAPLVCMHGDGGLKQIKLCKDDDVVYVTAHCSKGSSTVADNGSGSLDATALADLMLADGVPAGIQKIKLWVCEGAAGTDSFAEQFYKAAVNPGKKFPKAEITGYTKSLKTLDANGNKKAIIEDPSIWNWWKEKSAKASTVAVHFPKR
jgi:hypothetical protein